MGTHTPHSWRPTRSAPRRVSLLALAVVAVTFTATWANPAGSMKAAAAAGAAPAHGAVSIATPNSRPPAFPPAHASPLGSVPPAKVNPNRIYTSEPAPMGIGDFGIGASGNPYDYSTTEFLGNFSWQHLNINNGSGDNWFSEQLNVVLQFVQGGITYAYWIQDVAFMNTTSGYLGFVDNIWNFTSTCMADTAVAGNGTWSDYSGCEGWYYDEAVSQPGHAVIESDPGDFGLLVRSYTAGSGVPEVAFEYWDGVTSCYVTYDNVVWPWATALTSDNNFVVDGLAYNPLGLFYDAELVIAGPGGGTSTQTVPVTDTSSRLLHWNGHNFEAPPATWNFGSNTAESVSNVQSVFAHDSAGLPLTSQLNGTVHNASPDQAYTQDQVGELAITATGISSGTVAIPGDVWNFIGGSAMLTLTPGQYRVWVNSTSQSYNLGLCPIAADSTTAVSISTGCGPVVSTPTPSATGADVGQSVTFQSTLAAAGSGGDTYAWSTSPSGLGCSPSATLSLSCIPTAAGTYSINVTATDSLGSSSTSDSLAFTVSSDPTVGVPSASAPQVETGAALDLQASPAGGATPYSYQWFGLPDPCTGTTSASPACHPATPGTYGVNVTVTDANGYAVTSGNVSVSVLTGPSIAAPTASPVGSVDVGQSVAFTTSATGGSGGYAYSWSGLPTGCVSSSSTTIDCVPTGSGSFSITANVVDSDGGSATSGPLEFTVHGSPTIGVLDVAPASVDLGGTLTFSLSGAAAGGAGGYRYVWSGLPAGCASANATAVSCTPTATGAGTASVTVYDVDGGTSSTTSGYEVDTDPSFTGISVAPGTVDVGQNVTFAATNVSGGSGSYSYSWSGLPGCTGLDRASLACDVTSSGSANVTLELTDSNGFSAERSVALTVDLDPSVGLPVAVPGSATPGETVTFSIGASGGSAPYTFLWTGLPTGCSAVNAATITCQPATLGTSAVFVSVTDTNGYTVRSGVLTFVVASPSTTGGFAGLSPYLTYAILGGIAALVAVAVVVVLLRRSRPKPPKPVAAPAPWDEDAPS